MSAHAAVLYFINHVHEGCIFKLPRAVLLHWALCRETTFLCFLCDVPTCVSRPNLLSNSSDKISVKLVCISLFHLPRHVWESLRMTEFSGLSFFSLLHTFLNNFIMEMLTQCYCLSPGSAFHLLLFALASVYCILPQFNWLI